MYDILNIVILTKLTCSSNPMASRKSTPIPDNFSDNAPNDSLSNENPTANVGLPNLYPVMTSTWMGTPPASIDPVNRYTPTLSIFLSNSTGFMVKSHNPAPLYAKKKKICKKERKSAVKALQTLRCTDKQVLSWFHVTFLAIFSA